MFERLQLAYFHIKNNEREAMYQKMRAKLVAEVNKELASKGINITIN